MAAPCLPGAWVQDDANGRRAADGRARPAGLTVRVGPVSPAYRGTVRVLAVDRDARRLVLAARGRDERDDADVGPASARLELAVSPGPGGTGTLLHLDADLVVRGRVARCGRGVLGEVCRDLAVRFARALGELVATQPVPGRAPDTALTAAPHVRSRGGLRLPSRVTGAAV